MGSQYITPSNTTDLLTRKALASLPVPDYGLPFAPCSAIHPNVDSCLVVPSDTFLQVFRMMVPVYGALHFIPMLLLKRNTFLKTPMKMLLRAAWGTTRSSAFLGVFVSFFKGTSPHRSVSYHGSSIVIAMFCGQRQLYEWLLPKKIVPQALLDLFVSRGSFWVMGLLTGLSLLVEEKKRRAELAMYVLPKGLESAWVAARGKGLVMRTGQYGESLVCCSFRYSCSL